MGATTPEEILGMSDEDFMNELAPVVEPAAVKTPEEIAAEEEAARAAQDIQEAEAERVAAEQAKATATVPVEDADNTPPVVEPADKAPVVDPVTKTPEQVASESAKVEGDTGKVDYQKAYEAVMAPFKANGKTMQVQSPEEVVALMQMGANYTRKMQELQPQRKTLLLLENNGLLDEGKLSYLIDLSKGDPEAIKKLIKDSNFDVMNVDLDKESTYQGGNHTVTDEEVNFRTVLDELNSNPVGKETLNAISSTWDQASKEVLWSNPEVMTTIHAQRESGIYNRITTEMERRKTFGQIQPGTPFLHAYKAVGDDLQKSGAFADLIKQPEAPATASTPVAVKASLPKPTGTDPRIAAAAVHHSSAVKTDKGVNPLAMSDEDFLKMPP
ncbi:hypothetical protein, partial [Aurantimicrobium sp.]|uniref:hypothetical protein n=1 Tax=Aurantimicrobium sp. TaxID=1930784 RepID=UPI002FC8DB37